MTNLSEEALRAPTVVRGKVDVDVVVLGRYWLLYEWLVEDAPIDLQNIIHFMQCNVICKEIGKNSLPPPSLLPSPPSPLKPSLSHTA